MSTTVVNINDDCGYDEYVGRGRGNVHLLTPGRPGERGWLGNPYRIERDVTRAAAIALFRDVFLRRVDADPAFAVAVIQRCRGKRLGCYCLPLACHGDVIAEWCDTGR